MKKIFSILSVVIIALCTFTSCDEDMMLSYDLEGVWRGDMRTYYEHTGHTKEYTYTEISFDRDIENEYTSGSGYWTDYYGGGEFSRMRIYWEVKNKHIFNTFRTSRTTIEIYNYKLNSNHFRGSFQEGTNTFTNFDLTKVRNYEDYGDSDYIKSYTLKGTWEGDMYTYYEINGRKQKATYTEIMFTKDPGESRSGYGYWVDHFSNRPGDYYYSRIDWEVRNKTIYITFRSDNTTIEIYNYKLSENHFKGWFRDGVNTNTEFDLVKTRDDYDSYDYDYGYGDGYYDYWGYSKATRSSDNSENVEIPVRRFIKQ